MILVIFYQGSIPTVADTLDRGYPFFTENGNIILDCDFGTIKNPKMLSQNQTTGVLESGIFLRKPDVIYRAKTGGKFDML